MLRFNLAVNAREVSSQNEFTCARIQVHTLLLFGAKMLVCQADRSNYRRGQPDALTSNADTHR